MMKSQLRALRLSLGYSQAFVAARAGVSQFYISQLETGQRRPGRQVAEALAHLFSVDAGWLFGKRSEA